MQTRSTETLMISDRINLSSYFAVGGGEARKRDENISIRLF